MHAMIGTPMGIAPEHLMAKAAEHMAAGRQYVGIVPPNPAKARTYAPRKRTTNPDKTPIAQPASAAESAQEHDEASRTQQQAPRPAQQRTAPQAPTGPDYSRFWPTETQAEARQPTDPQTTAAYARYWPDTERD